MAPNLKRKSHKMFLLLLLLFYSPSLCCVIPQCKCDPDSGLIDCSQQGLLDVPTDSLQALIGDSTYKKLNLSWNGIFQLSAEAFAPARFEMVDLSNNYLRNSISPLAFKGLENQLKELYLGSLTKDNGGQPNEDSLAFLLRLVALRRLSIHGFNLGHLTGKYWQNLPELEELNLIGSRITTIQPSALTGALVNTLKKLQIQSNSQLSQLEHGLFANLTKLRSLSLSNNQFSTLPENLLPSSVEVLDLTKNKLDKIPFKLNRGFESLETIDLSENIAIARLNSGDLNVNSNKKVNALLQNCQITGEIDDKLSDNWDRLRQVDLSGNPVWCDCSTTVLVRQNEFARNALVGACQMPEILRGRHFATLSTESGCNEITSQPSVVTTAVSVSVSVFVFVLFLVLLIVCIWRRRATRLAAAQPLATSTTQHLRRPQQGIEAVEVVSAGQQTSEPYYAEIPDVLSDNHSSSLLSSPNNSIIVITRLPPPLPPRVGNNNEKRTVETSL